MRSIVSFISSVLVLVGCGPKERNTVRFSEADLAPKAEGYNNEWVCIGQLQDSNGALLVSALQKSKTGKEKYQFVVDRVRFRREGQNRFQIARESIFKSQVTLKLAKYGSFIFWTDEGIGPHVQGPMVASRYDFQVRQVNLTSEVYAASSERIGTPIDCDTKRIAL